jgi:hypothetical protein
LAIPTELHDEQLASQYRVSTGIDNDKAIFHMPNDLDSSVTGFLSEIAASTKYIETLARNKAANIEFAPCLGPTNGRVAYANPVKQFNKTEREYLEDFRINTVIFERNVSYFNDNWTAKTVNDVLAEEQNRRIFNRINRDVAYIMKQFIGEENTTKTRSKVKDVISTYLNTFIFSQYYRPEDYQIICDESNNTDQDRRDNKLNVVIKVRLRRAIKYIDVLNKAYPVGVSF